MEFQDNANVYTSDGKEAGNLHRVVIEPETKEVTHLVIQSGLLFKNDKVIPVTNVVSAEHEKVTLNCTVDDIKEMSPLKIEFQVPNDASGQGRTYDPVTGGMSYAPALTTETRRTIPEELVALKEGAQVISDDNKHVGNVESVLTEPANLNVSHFIVSHGLLSKTRKSIPMQWVKILDEDAIHLSFEAQEFETLPPIQELQDS
jgi:uncharacterized protein YrrD